MRFVCQAEFILKVFSKIAYFKENFMKNKKFLAALLLAAVAFLFSACTQSNGGGTNNSGSGSNTTVVEEAFQMNTVQKAAYDAAISEIVDAAAMSEIPAATVAQKLEQFNTGFAAMGFQVVDTKAGQSIAEGTSEADLKARFVPKKK